VIVSPRVRLGEDNRFYPNVVIECDDDSTCEIGSGNVFWPGTLILVTGGGSVTIGSGNTIGQGGVQIKADGSSVRIGSRTRLVNAAEILGPSDIGDGAQVLGPISVRFTSLAAGGDFGSPDPDLRGAVLKGMGTARNLVVGQGEVVNGLGDFAAAPIERQSHYHPPAASPPPASSC
jgi:UDP-3-O-[3-hydroxymyristoyl] glucosamine N-acyltransferase